MWSGAEPAVTDDQPDGPRIDVGQSNLEMKHTAQAVSRRDQRGIRMQQIEWMIAYGGHT